MAYENEKYCTILIHAEKEGVPASEEISEKLESKKDSVKVEALEQLILLMINGEPYPKLLMTVIRFVVTSNDHRLKKLLGIYWELVEKTKENGDLKEEMILVCNALRNDLMHPNEYCRGSTLRLLCRMKYYRILEPLKEAVLRNLSHRHSYVRRNAVMCVFAIVHHFGVEVMPEAPEDVEQLLLVEGDLSTKRNAFLMLLHCDSDRAIKYMFSMHDQVTTMGDLFQLCILNNIQKLTRANPAHKGRFLRIVFMLATSNSMAVSYDCANTLVALSSSPLAVQQALSAYVQLLTEQSDNNVKLIVLDRLQELRKHHKGVMEGMVMDVFRALSCPSLDVRKKVMDICLGSMISQRNIKDVVGLLKKEVIKTMGYEAQGVVGNLEYRRLLIKAMHACTAQYAEEAQSVMFLLMDFLTEPDQSTATEVVMFLRELIANHPDLRGPILQKLADVTTEVHQSRVIRGCLWLFGEYCEDEDLIDSVVTSLISSLRPLPLKPKPKEEGKKKEDKKEAESTVKVTTKTVVLADGTYGTQNVYEGGDEPQEKNQKDQPASALKTLVLGGDILLSAMLGVTLTKLSLKNQILPQGIRNEILFVVVNLLKLIQNSPAGGDKCDSAVRLTQCVRVLTSSLGSDGNALAAALIKSEWGSDHGRTRLTQVLDIAKGSSDWTNKAEESQVEEQIIPPEESIVFRQLRERKGQISGAINDTLEDDFDAARGMDRAGGGADGLLFAERLAKVVPLSGLSDPVYVEAFVQVHSFDLILELFMTNRTNEILQNVLVELSTQGDLKIVERPQGVMMEPGQQVTVTASIKVSSTETGIIFGYVTFDKKSADEKECSILNEVHIDILEYIQVAWIGELAFRTMWSEFEWENKININTTITEVGVFLEHIMQSTNMSIVGRKQRTSPQVQKKGSVDPNRGKLSSEEVQMQLSEAAGLKTLIDSSSFVAVNLYSKSIFGEDALANVSIEKLPDGKLAGSVRIRSRQQGIALSLGDRVSIVQRGLKR